MNCQDQYSQKKPPEMKGMIFQLILTLSTEIMLDLHFKSKAKLLL
jgi:hypothetical protein